MFQRILSYPIIIPAILVGFYPLIYVFVGNDFGLLASKPASLLGSGLWRTAFYTHITFGAVALLTGWAQFNNAWRVRFPEMHRQLGKIYVVSVLLAAIAGLCLSFFATGGFIASFGFGSLAIIWLGTTYRGFRLIRRGEVERHRILMTYSYACSFAAVTLRIWLPLLAVAMGDFISAYLVVAWLCWVPNLVVAWFLTRRRMVIQKT